MSFIDAAVNDFAANPIGLAGGFERLTQLAISLDKTSSWNSDLGKQIDALLEKDPVRKQQMDYLRRMLGGDTAAAVELYQKHDLIPPLQEAVAAVKLLREHGYPLAANGLEIVKGAWPKEWITAWSNTPADKRKPIDDYMLKKYSPSDLNRRALVQTAWEWYKKPPQDLAVPADTYFDFALWFGKDTGTINLFTAADLDQNGKKEGAIKLAKWLAKESPENYHLKRGCAGFIRDRGSKAEAVAFYRDLLATGKEPFVREVRLEYLEAIKQNRLAPEGETLATLQRDRNPLMAAEAHLADNKYAEAAALFHAQVTNRKAPLGNRLAAWTGLLDSDPESALQDWPKVKKELEAEANPKSEIGTQKSPIVWLGRYLGRVAERSVPPKPGVYPVANSLKPQALTQAKDWAPRLAAIMEQLILLDPIACLQPGEEHNPSLRGSAALLFALANQNDKAVEIARREITYLKQPPPGGWFTFPGTPDKDADKPREWKSPRKGETDQVMTEVTEAMGRYWLAQVAGPTAPIPAPPPNLGLITALADQAAASTDKKELEDIVTALAHQVWVAINYLDPPRVPLRTDQPPPPTREVNSQDINKIADALRAAIRNDLVAQNGGPLINQGLMRNMSTASNPQLLQTLSDLLIETLSRYGQVWKDPNQIAAFAETLARQLESRRVYDMKPYAQRLREKYPKP